MIYSVVPEELGPEVYERLKAYYAEVDAEELEEEEEEEEEQR